MHTTNPIVHTGLPLNARNNVTIIAIPVTGLKIAMIMDKYLFNKATIPNHRGMLEGTISSISSAFELS